MPAPTVPVSETGYAALCDLARETGQSLQSVLDRAIEDYRRKVFFDQLNAGYAALRADPEAWAEELAERKLWDTTLMDGLDTEERWTDDGRAITPNGGEKQDG